jgi:multiple sugar transport system permease protein
MQITAKHKRRPLMREETLMGYALVMPAILIVGLMVMLPALVGFVYSFQNRMIGFEKVKFVGLSNYITLLQDARLGKAVLRSIEFATISVTFKAVIGLAVALFLNQEFSGRGIARSVVLLPWALPLIVGILIFTWMYNDLFGVFNAILLKTGLISSPISFLGDRRYAFASGMLINIWRGIPFLAINMLAGLQSIPGELYEAARVDGASALQSFWHITLPGLRTVALIASLMSFIWTANEFETFWVLTLGGPGTATEVFPIITYKLAFLGLELGKAAAVPIMLMPFFSILIVFLVRAVRGQEEER